MKLLIVESPGKIKTISKFLGKGYKIVSTIGHIKDLPKKELGVKFNDEIKVDYEVLEGKNKVIADICKEARKSDLILLASDPDREGEIIAWHVQQELSKIIKDKNKINRITFNEITKQAINEAISNPSSIDENKVAAQQARRILDRLVGYEVSPILWQKIKRGLSAGRVQSVALKLIVDREGEIKKFQPKEYWSIQGEFLSKAGSIIAALTHIGKKKLDVNNEKDAKKLVSELKKPSYVIDSIKDSKRLKNPNPPFMTSTLQQSAYNQLGLSVQRTMQTAQSLYEGVPLADSSTQVALITYMRTDSLRVSDSAIKETRKYISKNFSKEYLPTKANLYAKKTKGKKVQDAHEAIRPIDVNITPESVKQYLSKDASKLYELIWKRFVASQLKPAQYAQRQVIIKGDKFIFKATGSTLIFDGFLKVYNVSEEEKEDETSKNNSIPKGIEPEMFVDLKKVSPKQHFTQPPPRYTQASLVKELEKEGVGRPSTYAAILRTIQTRSYTELDNKKRFLPTELGIIVTKMLSENLPKIINLKFTAQMEEELDKIASGELERDKLIKDFYSEFEKDLETFRGQEKKKVTQKTGLKCPECKKGELLIRFGKAGAFAGCSDFPECKFTSNFERTEDDKIKLVEPEQPKVLDEKCPKCSNPLRQVVGRYGPFIACSGYPKCKYISPIKAGFKCPLCKDGDVVQRTWKGKKFWGCSNYPKCTFSVFGEIEKTPCPKCKWPFLAIKITKDSTTLFCANKSCDYKKEK